jgi:FMN phosphatase YigB (HAD superfamily)
VGDRLDTDVAGAKAAGMTAVWLNATGASDDTGKADVIAAGWPDIVRLTEAGLERRRDSER